MIKTILPSLCYVAVMLVCLIHFREVAADPIDDAFIDFRYAENLLLGNGLVFNVGEKVEGYTNLLWILLLALTKNLGVSYIDGARILAGIFYPSTVLLAMKLIQRETRSLFAGTACGIALSFTYSIVASFALGLETSLFSFWITACFYSLLSKAKSAPIWLAACCAGLMTTRAEGMFLALVFAACLVWVRTKMTQDPQTIADAPHNERADDFEDMADSRRSYIGAALTVFFLAALETWRLCYYHELLPNSVMAKRDGGTLSLEQHQAAIQAGLTYVYNGLGWPKIAIIAACCIVLSLFVWKKLDVYRKRYFLAGGMVLGFGLTVAITAKGDWMPFARLLTPYYPVLLVLLLSTAVGAFQPTKKPLMFFLNTYIVAQLLLVSGIHPPWKAIVGVDAGATKLAFLFKEEYKPGDVFASGVIGALGYYSMPSPLQDILGLTNAEIAKSQVMASPFGKSVPAVVARWEPTIIHHNFWPYLVDIFKDIDEPYMMANSSELIEKHNFIFVKARSVDRFRERFKNDFDAEFVSKEEGFAKLKEAFPNGE